MVDQVFQFATNGDASPVPATPVTVPSIASPDDLALRRVESPDLVELQSWLVGRITARFPDASPAAIIGFLRGCIGSNEWWFCRTRHAVGLAQLFRAPLDPRPIAQEFFVLAMEDGSDEAMRLYRPMAAWAAYQNASRLIVNRFTDVPKPSIENRLECNLRALPDRIAWLGDPVF